MAWLFRQCVLVLLILSVLVSSAVLPGAQVIGAGAGAGGQEARQLRKRTLYCTKATWTDIAEFYLVNYIAHAATIITSPGQSTIATVRNVLMALFFPASGIARGAIALCTGAIFADTDLQTAARAGALCTVVWVGDGGDKETSQATGNGGVQHLTAETRPGQVLRSLRVVRKHGRCPLSEGYQLVVLPRNATFENDDKKTTTMTADVVSLLSRMCRRPNKLPESPSDSQPRDPGPVSLSGSSNMAKILVSILQLCNAIFTLYKARGDQIKHFGFAAYGLTVVPYAWMSLINLFGTLICPQYREMYIVGSDGLDQMRRQRRGSAREGHATDDGVSGIIGRLSKNSEKQLQQLVRERITDTVWRGWDTSKFKAGIDDSVWARGLIMLAYPIATCLALVPWAVVGGLSAFQSGDSAVYQRVWTLMWLGVGSIIGLVELVGAFHRQLSPISKHLAFMLAPITMLDRSRYMGLYRELIVVYWLYMCLYAVPAIGGYVVVGQMMRAYVTCTQVD